jgi:hypothetical protein
VLKCISVNLTHDRHRRVKVGDEELNLEIGMKLPTTAPTTSPMVIARKTAGMSQDTREIKTKQGERIPPGTLLTNLTDPLEATNDVGLTTMTTPNEGKITAESLGKVKGKGEDLNRATNLFGRLTPSSVVLTWEEIRGIPKRVMPGKQLIQPCQAI